MHSPLHILYAAIQSPLSAFRANSPTKCHGSAVGRGVIAWWVKNWMPSLFLFAIILPHILFIAGSYATDAGPVELTEYWYDGFCAFLTFSM